MDQEPNNRRCSAKPAGNVPNSYIVDFEYYRADYHADNEPAKASGSGQEYSPFANVVQPGLQSHVTVVRSHAILNLRLSRGGLRVTGCDHGSARISSKEEEGDKCRYDRCNAYSTIDKWHREDASGLRRCRGSASSESDRCVMFRVAPIAIDPHIVCSRGTPAREGRSI